jgi:hypothetical protein
MSATAANQSRHPLYYTYHKLLALRRQLRKGHLKTFYQEVYSALNFGMLASTLSAFIRKKEVNLQNRLDLACRKSQVR